MVLLSSSALDCKQKHRSPSQRAEQIYLLRCASCHGERGQGNAKLALPSPPRDLSDPELYRRLDDAALARVIKDGNGPMPAFGKFLNEDEIRLVITHLHTLERPR